MLAAGAVAAAELDVNWSYTRFFVYDPRDATAGPDPVAPLIPKLRHAAGEYTEGPRTAISSTGRGVRRLVLASCLHPTHDRLVDVSTAWRPVDVTLVGRGEGSSFLGQCERSSWKLAPPRPLLLPCRCRAPPRRAKPSINVRSTRAALLPDGAVVETAVCTKGTGTAPVQEPQFLWNGSTDTGWFSSPAILELSDGTTTTRALVVPSYSVDVFSATGKNISHIASISDRIYAPAPIADIDGDGATDLVIGSSNGAVAAYSWTSSGFAPKPGWAGATTCSAGQCPETRGMAAADLDGDGTIETVFTTTNTATGGSQVFVYAADGSIYQPASAVGFTAWPRYNTATGPDNDADFNGPGNSGYGCYGLNVAIGNIDDDPELEIVVTYDNHQINAFNHDGTSLLASSYFTNPRTSTSTTAWAGASSSGGPTRPSRPTTTTCTRTTGPIRAPTCGSSGPRAPPRSPTSTATGSTTWWAFPTASARTLPATT